MADPARTEARNRIAQAVEHAHGGWVPLSVRYGAADAALALLDGWMDAAPEVVDEPS